MRDLYAVQFKLPEAHDSEQAVLLAAEWCSRATGGSVPAEALLEAGTHDGDEGKFAEILRHGDLWSATVTSTSDLDSTMAWHTQASIGGPSGAIVTVRIGLGSIAPGSPRVAPLLYEFGSPALVRTLLREFAVEDSGRRLVPQSTLLGASEIPRLVDLLASPTRRLPVLVLTGDPATGRTPIPDSGSGAPEAHIARELAGLAHVVVLTSAFAGRNLTQAIGRERSVWHGAARIYWPGFTVDADPYDHRLWMPSRITMPRRPFVRELRSWLGTLSVARTPEHPGLSAARRGTVTNDADLLTLFETENERLEGANREFGTQLAELERENARLEAKLQALSFGRASQVDDPDDPVTRASPKKPTSVREALDIVDEEFGDEIVFLDSARDSADDFDEYLDPEKALRALRAVAEASASQATGGLGMSLVDFFSDRGFGYSSTNEAAKARKYKPKYTIHYEGERRVMEPHLKVDEATSPDQCMRVYWWKDDDAKVFVVGHVGRHLPPIPGS